MTSSTLFPDSFYLLHPCSRVMEPLICTSCAATPITASFLGLIKRGINNIQIFQSGTPVSSTIIQFVANSNESE